MSLHSELFRGRATHTAHGIAQLEVIQMHGRPLTSRSHGDLCRGVAKALGVSAKNIERLSRSNDERGQSVILRVRIFDHMSQGEFLRKLGQVIASMANKLKFVQKTRRKRHSRQHSAPRRPFVAAYSRPRIT
jgi:hypothetical protein